MFELKVEYEGLDKFHKLVDAFTKKNRKKLLRKYISKVSAVVSREIKRIIRTNYYRSGNLAKSIGRRVKYYSKTDTLIVVIGVRSKYVAYYQGQRIVPRNYGKFIIEGRKSFMQQYTPTVYINNRRRQLGKRNRYIGQIRKHDVFTEATNKVKAQAEREALNFIAKEIENGLR